MHFPILFALCICLTANAQAAENTIYREVLSPDGHEFIVGIKEGGGFFISAAIHDGKDLAARNMLWSELCYMATGTGGCEVSNATPHIIDSTATIYLSEVLVNGLTIHPEQIQKYIKRR